MLLYPVYLQSYFLHIERRVCGGLIAGCILSQNVKQALYCFLHFFNRDSSVVEHHHRVAAVDFEIGNGRQGEPGFGDGGADLLCGFSFVCDFKPHMQPGNVVLNFNNIFAVPVQRRRRHLDFLRVKLSLPAQVGLIKAAAHVKSQGKLLRFGTGLGVAA